VRTRASLLSPGDSIDPAFPAPMRPSAVGLIPPSALFGCGGRFLPESSPPTNWYSAPDSVMVICWPASHPAHFLFRISFPVEPLMSAPPPLPGLSWWGGFESPCSFAPSCLTMFSRPTLRPPGVGTFLHAKILPFIPPFPTFLEPYRAFGSDFLESAATPTSTRYQRSTFSSSEDFEERILMGKSRYGLESKHFF